MAYRAIVQMVGASEHIEGEIDELPAANATFITLKHPRKRDGRDLGWVDYRTKFLLLTFQQIVSVEIMDPRSAELERKSTRSPDYPNQP